MSITIGRSTLKTALKEQSLDLKNAQLDIRFKQIEDYAAWHDEADADNRLAVAGPVDQATANAQLNALKAAINLHMADTDVHAAADAVNPIVAADATNIATAETLATAMRASLLAHFILDASHTPPNSWNNVTTTGKGDVVHIVTKPATFGGTAAADLIELMEVVYDMSYNYHWHTFRGPFAVDDPKLPVYGT